MQPIKPAATRSTALASRLPAPLPPSPPATHVGSGIRVAPSDFPEPAQREKRTGLTRNACRRCRAQKHKCDGKHPNCKRCFNKGLSCAYDVSHEGITRMEHLKEQLDATTQDLHRGMSVLRGFLSGSDEEAVARLAQWRRDGSIEAVVGPYVQRAPRHQRDSISASSQESIDLEEVAHARLAAAITEVQQSVRMLENLEARSDSKTSHSARTPEALPDWYNTVMR
ncbi:hypothetical protein LTR17_011478 [Elasticomyces elasticus]|nr:hypothetical protein LTR17_011478 [Elasticomyces elasticus]